MAMEGTKMRIAVLSGKGGTGKTLVSVNLAAAAKYQRILTVMLKNQMATFLSPKTFRKKKYMYEFQRWMASYAMDVESVLTFASLMPLPI